MVVPQHGWLIIENPMTMDGGTPISENLHVCVHEHFWYTCIPRNGQSPVGALVGSKPPESETDIFLASKGRSFTTYGGVTSG